MSNSRKLGWFILGGSVVGVIGALGVFNLAFLLVSLIGFVISIITIAFIIKNHYLNEKPLESFFHGSWVFGFIQSYVLALVGDRYELPLVGLSGWIILFTALGVAYIATQIINPTFLGL